jgi:hypothetical protein
MQLLVLESTSDDPVVKNLRGVGAVTTTAKLGQGGSELRLNRSATSNGANPLEHTNSNQSITTMNSVNKVPTGASETDAKSMFPFRVKHLGKSDVYTLYAPTALNRQDWCEKILLAKTQHAASLLEQNAEPFSLRVMADTAFGNDVLSSARRLKDQSAIWSRFMVQVHDLALCVEPRSTAPRLSLALIRP